MGDSMHSIVAQCACYSYVNGFVIVSALQIVGGDSVAMVVTMFLLNEN
jgi:hypothetical protein